MVSLDRSAASTTDKASEEQEPRHATSALESHPRFGDPDATASAVPLRHRNRQQTRSKWCACVCGCVCVVIHSILDARLHLSVQVERRVHQPRPGSHTSEGRHGIHFSLHLPFAVLALFCVARRSYTTYDPTHPLVEFSRAYVFLWSSPRSTNRTRAAKKYQTNHASAASDDDDNGRRHNRAPFTCTAGRETARRLPRPPPVRRFRFQ